MNHRVLIKDWIMQRQRRDESEEAGDTPKENNGGCATVIEADKSMIDMSYNKTFK